MFNNKVSENDKQPRKFPLLEMFLICEPITMQIWSHMTRGLFSFMGDSQASKVVEHTRKEKRVFNICLHGLNSDTAGPSLVASIRTVHNRFPRQLESTQGYF